MTPRTAYTSSIFGIIAAARHLKQRGQMPRTVRIRYLFLRGLDSGGSNGIWSWDIPTASLAEWL